MPSVLAAQKPGESLFTVPLLLSLLVSLLGAPGCQVSDTFSSSTSTTTSEETDDQAALEQPLSGSYGISTGSDSTLTLTSISPTEGGIDTLITLEGTNFVSGATVTVGGVDCNGTTITSAYSATCRTPSNPNGLMDVVITNPDGTSDLLDTAPGDGYTYNSTPTITAVSPTVGGSGNSITITGTDFLAGATVLVGNTDCPVTATAATTLTCTAPSHIPGLVNIQITNGDGQTVSKANAFTYAVLGAQIVTGLEHSCALVNGGVQCWGNNTYGQLGDGTTNSSASPVSVTGLTSGVQQITAGDYHTCAVVNGAAKCWGHNFYGQLGVVTNTQTPQPNPTPVTVANSSENVISISAGAFHTCAMVAEKGAQCWGSNEYGQLGTTTNSGTTNTNYIPKTVFSLDATTDILPLPTGTFESAAQVQLWYEVQGTFTGLSPRSALPPSAWSLLGRNAMRWDYENSYITPLQREYLFSAPRDLSTHQYIRIQFYNDAVTTGAGFDIDRTISITLTSGLATQVYTLQDDAGGATFPVNTWIDFRKAIDSPDSTTGAGFDITAVDSISLSLEDSATGWTSAIIAGAPGNGTTPPTSGTVYWDQLQLEDSVEVEKIYAGGFHTCAVRQGKTVCWGLNSYGQLGNATTIDWSAQPTPTAVSATMTSEVSSLSLGRYHSCGIKNGAAFCWGLNDYQQLGDGTAAAYQTSPQALSPMATFNNGVEQISAGYRHTCLIKNGATYCWGRNNSGQVGDTSTTDRTTPTAVSNFGTGSLMVSASVDHTCGIKDGLASCWGLNAYGEVGDTTIVLRNLPTAVYGLGSSTGIHTLGSGYGHTCAIVNGALQCWGWNAYGQLGNNTTTDASSPTAVLTALNAPVYAQAVVGGATHTCAIQNGAAYCWGSNTNGQLGDGTTTDQLVPNPVSVLTTGVQSLSAGSNYSCGIKNGAGYCWGVNTSGQLGDGTTTQRTTPTALSASTIGTTFTSGVSSIVTGLYHACALKNGAVSCWGNNTYGQVGINTSSASESQPQPVTQSDLGESFTSGVLEITAGAFHACALKANGIWCWGLNNYGQLGSGSTTLSMVPVPVSSVTAAKNLTAGYYHTCALVNGDTKCWGYNVYGQLGNYSVTNSPIPVKMYGSSGTQAVSTGAHHTCILISGGIQCSGYNFFGQLGNGTSTHRNILGAVSGF